LRCRLHIPGINDDYVGTAPDIGAFEYPGYGFTLAVNPSSRVIPPGSVTTYTLSVQPIGRFTAPTTLTAASPSPSLTLGLVPTAVVPPAQAILTVTDAHTGPWLLPGLWYNIPITGTGGGVTNVTTAHLLVGGARLYLPVVMRGNSDLTTESQRAQRKI